MKTRRKTRKEQEASSSQAAEEPVLYSPTVSVAPSQGFHVHIPEDIPLSSLTELLPDTPLDSPNPEAIIYIYKLLLAQAGEISSVSSELEEARAQLIRKDVELDQAVQDKESAVSELEQSVESARSELKIVITQRDELRASHASLQSQLANLNSSQTSRSSELDVLRTRVEEVEREKRELVGVVDRLRSDGTQAEEEIRILRENLKKAREEISELQSQIREVRSTETTNKFKVQSLEQQLQLAKQDSERNAFELDSKIGEFSKYRRDANAQRASLQSSYDALIHESEACKSELEVLKRSYEQQTEQLKSALEKVNSLQDQLAEEGAASKAQAEVQARLIDLLEKRNAEAKKRVEEVDREWDRTIQEHQEREDKLREQLQREKDRADRLDANLTRILENPDSTLGPLSPPEPSPSASIVAGFMKGTKLSDIFDENRRMKEELQRVKVENVRLMDTTTELISKVQEMAPQLGEQRFEYERQRQETIQISQQLSSVLSQRDSSLHYAKELEQKLATSKKENILLEDQLKDLGLQVQALLREVSVFQNPTLATVDPEDLPPDTRIEDMDAMITQELVVFKHLPAFQEQYTKHLRVIRELGDRLETETRKHYEEQTHLESQALEEAAAAIAVMQEELDTQRRTHDIELRAYIQERDMCKARLSAQSPSKPSPGAQNGHGDAQPTEGEYEALLADLQRNFDIYRTESGIDMKRLREELQDSQRETAQLQAALAKANAKLENHTGRYNMLNNTYGRQKQELDGLRRRNEDLLNQVHRIETTSHQVSEQLATTAATLERLRHEAATLRAEKEFWKTIERRLTEENQSLSKEKAQLSDVMTNINRMHHDLEQSVQSDRRRLETQVQLLESQTQELKSQLMKEREGVRHLSLKKDLETKELHDRIDRLMADLSRTRESLVAAETSQAHMHERVDDLSKRLDASLEKLSVYERRQSDFPGIPSHELEGRSREEQLEAEVADLRATIKLVEIDLTTARSQMEQFRDLSQASEAAFEKVNSAYEEYKIAAQVQMSQREADVQSLGTKLQSAEAELTSSAEKMKDLQQQLEEERKKFVEDKQTLEATIVDMSSSAINSQADEAERANLTKIQEERATAAEERYQREVIAHAEAIKSVEALKMQLATAQAHAREKQTAADTAQSILTMAEASWKSQKEALDKEIADINTRYQDLKKQNSILHEHLESVSSQASQIRQVAEHSSNVDTLNDTDTATNLRPVVAWLRSEKEIVDLQLELTKQENSRLKTQAEHFSRGLEETRSILAEERERATGSMISAAQHAELLERINQLNLLRESNATLRSECQAHRKRSESLETELAKLRGELEPLKDNENTLRAQLELKEQQLKRFEHEAQQWQERNQQILTKYERIDPAEMQQLKDKVSQLETEREKQSQDLITNEKKMNAVKDNLQAFRTKYSELFNQSRTVHVEKEELQAQLSQKTLELEQYKNLQVQIDDLKAENIKLQEAHKDELARLERQFNEEKAKLQGSLESARTNITAASSSANALVNDDGQQVAIQLAIDEATRAWEGERQELTKARQEAEQREKMEKQKSAKLINDNNQLSLSNKKFQERLTEQLKKQSSPAPNVEELVNTRVGELMAQKIQEHEAALQATVAEATAKVRSELTSNASGRGNAQPDAAIITASHQEELAALEKRLREQHAEEIKTAVASALASAPKTDNSPQSVQDLETMIKERLKDKEKEWEDRIGAIRKEASIKTQLKQQQIDRLQRQLKDLKDAGGNVPNTAAVGTPVKATASTETVTVSTTTPAPVMPSTPATPSTSSKPTAAKKPIVPATLPKKPIGTPAATEGPGPGPGVTTATGRGAGRGRGLAIRGGAAGRGIGRGIGRGAGILEQVNSAAAASPSGTSIVNAAKRQREEAESPGGDLAKRIKSASGPVTIQRNRLPPGSES